MDLDIISFVSPARKLCPFLVYLGELVHFYLCDDMEYSSHEFIFFYHGRIVDIDSLVKYYCYDDLVLIIA